MVRSHQAKAKSESDVSQMESNRLYKDRSHQVKAKVIRLNGVQSHSSESESDIAFAFGFSFARCERSITKCNIQWGQQGYIFCSFDLTGRLQIIITSIISLDN